MPESLSQSASDFDHEIEREAFAERLTAKLREKGWNQSELARQVGVTRDAVSSWVNKRNLPTPDRLLAIAKALDCAPNDLAPRAPGGSTGGPVGVHIEQARDRPGFFYVRINGAITAEQARQIFEVVTFGAAGAD